ncbi:hypothetical protein [Bradyrhizobium sp. LA6.7]|uniref:hypothetical protein n=1 Tax=unclassified Bradyrhizobium TaxID=2631580 RepID=UPI00339203EF
MEMTLDDVPTVTSMDKFESAVRGFERGGGRAEFMAKMMAIGLPSDCIRYLAAYPGRTMMVRED